MFKKKIENIESTNFATVTVSGPDRLDFNLVLSGINTVFNQVTRPLPVNMTDEALDAFYTAIFEKFKELKISEHKLRVKFVEEYKVPYAFSYTDGVIKYIKED